MIKEWLERAKGDDVPELDGVVKMTDYFEHGTAFFPGGYGVLRGLQASGEPEFPRNGIMFVGNNLDGAESFAARLANGAPNGNDVPGIRMMKTWDVLRDIMAAVCSGCSPMGPNDNNFESSRIFCTNTFFGLKAGEPVGDLVSAGTQVWKFLANPTGKESAKTKAKAAYVEWSSEFLRTQIKELQPKLIVLLGSNAKKYWRGKNWEELTWENFSHTDLTVEKLGTLRILPLPHPSLGGSALVKQSADAIGKALGSDCSI